MANYHLVQVMHQTNKSRFNTGKYTVPLKVSYHPLLRRESRRTLPDSRGALRDSHTAMA